MYIIYNPDTNTAHEYHGVKPAAHCESIFKKDTSRAITRLLICTPFYATRMHEGKFQIGRIEQVDSKKVN